MALPKVRKGDVVNVVFKNQTKATVDADDLYASSKYHRDSQISVNFFLKGGKGVQIVGSDKTAIWMYPDLDDEFAESEVRVERKFIDSIELVSRSTFFEISDGYQLRIPSDPKQDTGLFYSEDHRYSEEDYTPANVRQFLKKFKACYLTKKKAKKKSKKKSKKLPKPLEKGAKLTKSTWKPGMVVNFEAIDWDDSNNNLSPLELHFVFKGKLKNVEIDFWNTNGKVRIKDPFWDGPLNHWLWFDTSLIKSMTLAKDWSPPPPKTDPEPSADPSGKKLGHIHLGHDIYFYEKDVQIGCKTFSLEHMKKLYKALAKVYGEPK